MCWIVCYIYKCSHDSTTAYKCWKCAKSDAHCNEAGLPEACHLEEVCHDCGVTPDSLADDLAADLSLEGDRLILPLQTSHLVNVAGRRLPIRRRLRTLRSISPT